ncbi:MAG TPA: nucleotidyltransferase domain-containing protein [Gammaproteobacteria bacterium]|nr:nucleotidyltransferase domain-containing protein [Gammaproteobacteria bacterium]
MKPEQTKLLNDLVAYVRAEAPELLALYRFGSWGGIHARADSDLDLALLTPRPLDPLKRWELEQQLAVLARCNVDLVDLRAASTVLRARVIAEGERVFCAAESLCSEFEDVAFSAYARLNEERRAILQDIRQRGSVYGR